jgi:hypothetical protein
MPPSVNLLALGNLSGGRRTRILRPPPSFTVPAHLGLRSPNAICRRSCGSFVESWWSRSPSRWRLGFRCARQELYQDFPLRRSFRPWPARGTFPALIPHRWLYNLSSCADIGSNSASPQGPQSEHLERRPPSLERRYWNKGDKRPGHDLDQFEALKPALVQTTFLFVPGDLFV